MKISIQKFLLSLFLIIEIGSAAVFANINRRVPETKSPFEITMKPKITVYFIIARRRDCGGFGICRLEIGLTSDKVANGCTASLTTDDFNRNALVLEVNKANGITTATYEKYFKSGFFLIEDDAPIDPNIIRELGLTGSKTFVAGKYPVKEANGILYISVAVK